MRRWADWFAHNRESTMEHNAQVTPISPFKHKGMLLTCRESGKLNEALLKFGEIWYQHAKKSGLPPPHTNISTTYNGHECAAIFPCGGRPTALLWREEEVVHENFTQLLLIEYPEIQWVHVFWDANSASILGHTGVE